MNQYDKTRSVTDLNIRLKQFKEQKSRLAIAGEQSLSKYYEAIQDKIPIAATGKLGQKYYENELKNQKIEEENLDSLNKALNNLKTKKKKNELVLQGFVRDQEDNQQDYIDQPIAELFELPNKHYQKLFNPDAFYDINVSDDDQLEKQLKHEIENKLNFQKEKQQKKNNILQKININIQKQKQQEEQQQDEQQKYIKANNVKSPQKKILKKGIVRKNTQSSNKDRKIHFEDEQKKQDDSQSVLNVNEQIPKWKKQSIAFRAAMKQGKGQSISDNENLILTQDINSGLIKCEFCKRSFNTAASERHIPICKEKSNKMNFQRKKI